MSQHYYKTQHQGRDVVVLMGWDRPLQGYFMVIEYSDEAGVMDDEYLYDNLNDPALSCYMGLPPTADHFLGKLTSLGLSLPEQMVAGVLDDMKLNAGNAVTWHGVA